MSAIHRKKEHSDDEGEGWIVSYADLMTLLLCVFVLLFAMSSLDNDKVKAVSQAMKGYLTEKEVSQENTDLSANERQIQALRILTQVMDLGHPDELLTKLLKMENEKKETENLKDAAKKLGLAPMSTQKSPIQRFEVVLPVSGLFEPGGAQLTKTGLNVLTKLAPKVSETLRQENRYIEISGHSDNRPLPSNSLFSSTNMLSVARAEAASLAFIKSGVKERRIRILGKGSSEPFAAANPSDEKNNRIVISIISEDSK